MFLFFSKYNFCYLEIISLCKTDSIFPSSYFYRCLLFNIFSRFSQFHIVGIDLNYLWFVVLSHLLFLVCLITSASTNAQTFNFYGFSLINIFLNFWLIHLNIFIYFIQIFLISPFICHLVNIYRALHWRITLKECIALSAIKTLIQ
jgi:hypothetical protein